MLRLLTVDYPACEQNWRISRATDFARIPTIRSFKRDLTEAEIVAQSSYCNYSGAKSSYCNYFGPRRNAGNRKRDQFFDSHSRALSGSRLKPASQPQAPAK